MSMSRQEMLYDQAIESGKIIECSVCGQFRSAEKMEACEECGNEPICPACFRDECVCPGCRPSCEEE